MKDKTLCNSHFIDTKAKIQFSVFYACPWFFKFLSISPKITYQIRYNFENDFFKCKTKIVIQLIHA